MDPEEEVRRHLEALRYLIRASGWTQERIQHRLGWRKHRVSDLLHRKSPLTFEDLFAILELVGYTPAEYFQLATSLPVRPADDEGSS